MPIERNFFKMIEAGDLAFSILIKYAIVVFGCTKNGKTTLCHHLKNNILEGYKNPKNTEIQYRQTNGNRDKDAEIGDSFDSMTLIPNEF